MRKTLIAILAIGLLFSGCELFSPPEVFTISYDANGGASAPASVDLEDGESATVAAAGALAWAEHTFTGWNTKATAAAQPTPPGLPSRPAPTLSYMPSGRTGWLAPGRRRSPGPSAVWLTS